VDKIFSQLAVGRPLCQNTPPCN